MTETMGRPAADAVDHEEPTPLVPPTDITDFDAFARTHLPRLLSYAIVLTGDRELAADVVQEAMVRAHQHWSRVRSAERPDLYVKRMVTNEYLSWRRRWQVRNVVSASDEALRSRAPALPDHAEAVTHRIADRDALWGRLAKLPRRQRALVVLRYYEDLSDSQIAEVLGISRATVRSGISRALATLRIDAPTDPHHLDAPDEGTSP
ncbi:SigE family RNA polymerase sigma factor [Humibacter sp.]|uniref:SigE family RNA polymerase sigma factor n=1 Tax=Humibacter sp. TaxID=1940291 RepID=UPI002D182BB6|nr:SigE family RNA polymerase sigma factor [Humibacter sp.]HVX09319.1 SigE family RNA polymerase sigma factor [Humibacter sp.]